MKQNYRLTALCMLSTCLGGGCLPAAAARTSDATPLAIEDVLDVRSFLPYASPALSPNGKEVAIAIQDDHDENPPSEETSLRTGIPFKRTSVWVVDTGTGSPTVVSGGFTTNWGLSWSPDGRYLAFLSDRDGSGQAKVWLWNRSEGTTRKVSDSIVRGTEIQWLPDSRKLLVTTLPQDFSPDEYVKRVLRIPPNLKTGSFGATAVVFRSQAAHRADASSTSLWNLDLFLRDIALIDISTGSTKLVARGKRVAQYLVSPDGRHVAYTIPQNFEKSGSQQILFDLSIVSLVGDEDVAIGSKLKFGLTGGKLSWAPSSRTLAFRSGGMDEISPACHLVDARVGTLQRTGGAGSHSSPQETACLWDSLGKNIYFLEDGMLWRSSTNDGVPTLVARIEGRKIVKTISERPGQIWTFDNGQSTVVIAHDDAHKCDGFYRIDLVTGKATRLLEEGQCYTCVFGVDVPALALQDGEHFLYYSEDAQNPADIWIADRDFRERRQLTHLNPRLGSHKMGKAVLVDWTSDEGENLHGTLLLPSNYEAGHRYPLLVVVYGGENLSDGFDRFGAWFDGPFNMQLLATRGYAVLLPDSPEHVGTPLQDLAKAVLPGVNKIVDLGIADSKRVALLGHSKGGYGTVGLLVQTDRFRAAVEIDGFADLVSDYGYLDDSGAAWGTWTEHMIGGSVWGNRERYIENSPIFYLDRISTPLLIVHGSKDRSVPAFLADELFVDMRRLGKDVEYARYEGEDHSPSDWSYSNQLDLCHRLVDWFDNYLMTEGN